VIVTLVPAGKLYTTFYIPQLRMSWLTR